MNKRSILVYGIAVSSAFAAIKLAKKMKKKNDKAVMNNSNEDNSFIEGATEEITGEFDKDGIKNDSKAVKSPKVSNSLLNISLNIKIF